MNCLQKQGLYQNRIVLKDVPQCSKVKNNVLKRYTSVDPLKMECFSRQQALMFSISVLLLVRHRGKKRNRCRYGRKWVAPYLLQRDGQGACVRLIPGLRESEKEVYRNFTRMPSSVFDWLLALIRPTIIKQHTVFRSPISQAEQLVITLRFLATGE